MKRENKETIRAASFPPAGGDDSQAQPVGPGPTRARKKGKPLSPSERFRERLRELALKLYPVASAELAWDAMGPEEQKALGGSFPDAYGKFRDRPICGTIGMWIKAYDCSVPEAIIECAYFVGHLLPNEAMLLTRQLKIELGNNAELGPRLERLNQVLHSAPADDLQSQIRQLRRRCELVLIRRGDWLEVYWEQQRLEPLNVTEGAGRFLWWIAQRRRAEMPLTEAWLREQHMRFSLKDALHQMTLKQRIPSTLLARIEPREPKGYWLTVARDQIGMIEVPHGA